MKVCVIIVLTMSLKIQNTFHNPSKHLTGMSEVELVSLVDSYLSV